VWQKLCATQIPAGIVLEMMSKRDASGRLGQVQAPLRAEIRCGEERPEDTRKPVQPSSSPSNQDREYHQFEPKRRRYHQFEPKNLCRALRGANIR
jgi:hypothetical protein